MTASLGRYKRPMRRAARPMAAQAVSTETMPVSARKPLARSSASRNSGRALSMVSMRCPAPMVSATRRSKVASAAGWSAATQKRRLTRLPGPRRSVSPMSSMRTITRGERFTKFTPRSGSYRMAAEMRKALPPSSMVSPTWSDRRDNRLGSTQASPRSSVAWVVRPSVVPSSNWPRKG